MKTFASILLACVLSPLIGFSAPRQAPDDRSAPVVFEGRVLTEDGQPAVEAVVVSSAGGQTTTEANGSFRLSVALPYGVPNVRLTAVASDPSSQVGTTLITDWTPGRTTQVDTLQLQKSSGCQPSWLPTFGAVPGTDFIVDALVVFDDGSGGGPALYLAGIFTTVGGAPANGIAKWDGVSWSALGTGVGPTFGAQALTVFDDMSGGGPALYAGGDFAKAGGVTANHIAKWDGTTWSALGNGIDGGGASRVSALTVFDDGRGGGPALYVGGFFTMASGVSANHIAKWNGSSWSALGDGLSGALSRVSALAVFDDGGGASLYVGGSFTVAGAVPASYIAAWDGSSWSAIGSGTGGSVLALTVHDDVGGGGILYAGGSFSSAGGVPAKNIASWDGSSWSAIGNGLGATVRALSFFDDGSGPALYAGGDFGGYIMKWTGSSWSALGTGLGGINIFTFPAVRALTVFDDGNGNPALYVGGGFTTAGGNLANFITNWDGSSWGALGNGIGGSIRATTVFDDGQGGGPALYAAGVFSFAGGALVNHIAKWDGSGWSALGGGMGSTVLALTVFDDGKGGGPALYAGGVFSSAGGVVVNNIAKWDGLEWSALGSGTNDNVCALAVFDDRSGAGPALYVGGAFAVASGVAASHIAKWDGSEWSALGSGTNNSVCALVVFDDGTGGGPALCAGGPFKFSGRVLASRIAKWDGTSWSALGSGLNGSFSSVRALAVFDDGIGGGPALYAGGSFTGAGGVTVNNIAKWDGTIWSPLETGGSGVRGGPVPSVNALAVFDDGTGGGPALYAGGNFTKAGGVTANRIAKWAGTGWSALGSGIVAPPNSAVFLHALTVFDDGGGGGPALYAGGGFTTSPAGDSGLAKWGCAPPTTVSVFCTPKTTLVCGPANISAVGNSSATLSSGFVIEAQPVRGCRAGLLLYSDQPVQTGVNFGGPGNGWLCLSAAALRRAGPIESGGTSAQVCDGVLSIDVNRFRSSNWTAVGCNPATGSNNPAGFLSAMGTTVNAQMWGRDSTVTGQVLSDGVTWLVGP